MTIKTWFSCSSDPHSYTLDDNTRDKKPLPSPILSTSSDTSSNLSSPSSSQESNYSSLQSNLSLQTLPSIPSLQKSLSSKSTDLSVSHICLFSFQKNRYQITCLAVSNKHLYVASRNLIHVVDLSNNTIIDTFNDQDNDTGSVKSITFCNGNVITAHQDCKIRFWQITGENKRHKLISTLPTVKDRIRNSFLPKNYVSVRRHKKQLWIEHSDTVSGIIENNGLIYSVSWDKYLKIWRSKDRLCIESIKAHDDAINSVAVSFDGTVYTGSADEQIKVWRKTVDTKKHSLVATLQKHKSAVNALALSEDGTVLFSGACDRSILVWEKEDSAEYMSVTGALRGHTGAILCLINVSGLLMSGSADRTVRIWQRRGDSQEYCCLAVLEGHKKPVKSLVAVLDETSPNIVTVCSGSLDGEVKVWQIMVSNLKCSSSPPSYHT